MSHTIKPSTARQLFKLAHDIRQIEPWKDFSDNDWFGIIDPETGETQIVAIMGMGQQVFSVQLYLPEEGIRFWNHYITRGEIDTYQTLFQQRMLECEFCDNVNLPDEDIEFYETYGIKNPQAHALPVFRKTEPELYPWFLDEKDAHLLCHALVLTQHFHSHRSTMLDDDFLSSGSRNFPEIPLFTLKKDTHPSDATNWEYSRCPFPIASEKTIPKSPADDVFLNRFHKMSKQASPWEIGSSYIHQPSRDDDDTPPYYPVLTLCVDSSSETPPAPDVNHPHTDKALALRKTFSEAVVNYGYLPTELHVATPLALNAFEGLQEAYGIKVILKDSQPTLERLSPPIIAALSGELPEELLHSLQSGDFNPDDLPPEMRELMANLWEEEDEEDEYIEYSPPKSTSRFILRIDIKGAKPPIWRRISIPTDASFYDLHHAIQDAFNWENEHLHQFEIKNKYSRIIIQPDEGDIGIFNIGGNLQILDEFTTPISHISEMGVKKIQYTYDFGDNWQHIIKIEKVIETDIPNPLPTIIKGAGATPPEDCGGLPGYQLIMSGEAEMLGIYDEDDLEEIRNDTFDISLISFENPGELIELTPGYDVEDY